MPTYTGNNGDNTITGSNGDDTISGLGGNDNLSGGNGNDTISGGGDNDNIDGGNGNDNLSGDGGDDTIDGGNGNDTIDGGNDNDTLSGGNGNDNILGGAGNDTLLGENGNDNLTGGGGDDVIDGSNGFDTAYYSGPIGEYSFFSSGGYLHVVHLGGAGADGHDQIKRVERLVFADRVIDIGGGDNAPVAVDDHVFINEDTGTYSSGSASVKDNDFDFDGDALTVTPGVFAGTYGTLTLNANGTYSYTLFASAQALAQGQNVQDSFNYSVSDNDGSDTGTLVFHIAGVNDAPNADPDSAAAGENQTILIDVLANDDDIDNGAVLTVTTASAPAGQGTATVVGNQVQFNPGSDFDDLAVGQTEIVVISYSIADEHGATDSSTITVTVTGTNDAPVAVADTNSGDPVVESGVNPGNTPFPGDASAAGNVLANDTDVDTGDTKTVSAVNGSALNVGTAVTGTYGSVTIAGNGSYTYTLNNADPDTNALAQGASVNEVFSYTVQDSNGATSTTSLTITITGTNDAPTIDAGGTVDSGSVTELPNNDPNENGFTHTDSGTVAFDDADVPDTHSASFTPQGGGYLGTFTLDPVDQMGDSVGWDFSVEDSALDFLDEGETLTQTYTIEIEDANGATVTQDVTITLTGTGDGPQTEWYIDNSAIGSANTGTQADPYTSIAAFNAAQGMVGGPQVGHTVHLLAGTGTGIYAEADGINLLDDQILTGEATGAVRPTIVVTGGANHGIELAQNNIVSGLDIGDTMGADISDSNGAVGNLTIFDVGTSGTGQIIDIDQGGTLNVTLNSASSLGSAGGAIDLANVGGSFTVTGATTITGVHSGGGIDITGASATAIFAGGGTVATLTTTAVNYVGNSGSLAISGGFDILTTSGAGLNATGGGTVTVTGAGNSIASTTGTALNVVSTDIGLAGLTFESISSNGAVNGIVLDSTGMNAGVHGGLTVTGDGTGAMNGSGGLITNTTGAGISLTSTRDVSLTQLNVSNTAGHGIDASSVTNFTYQDASIVNAGNGNGEHGMNLLNLFGTSLIEDVRLDDIQEDGIQIRQTLDSDGNLSTFDLITIRRLDVEDHQAGFGEAGIEAQADLASSLQIVVDDSDFAINANATLGIATSTAGSFTGAFKLTIQDSSFDGSNAFGSGSIQALGGGTGTSTYLITGNTITNTAFDGIRVNNDGGHTNATITNNDIDGGPTNNGEGITLLQDGNGTMTVLISGNDMTEIAGNQIHIYATDKTIDDGIVDVEATITNNTGTAASFGAGLLVEVGDGSGVAKNDVRINVSGNDLNGTEFVPNFDFDITISLYETSGASLSVTQASDAALSTANNGNSVSSFANPPNTITYSAGTPPLPPMPLLLADAPAGGDGPVGDDGMLSQAELADLVEAAIQRWSEAGATPEQIASMRAVSFVISDLAGNQVGSSDGGRILLDDDGGGYGWFVDATPGEDSEFEGSGTHLIADAGGAAEGRIDALTVILHELGHRIGLGDDYHAASESDLMHGYVDLGERRLPDGVFEAEPALICAGRAEWGDMPLTYPDHPIV